MQIRSQGGGKERVADTKKPGVETGSGRWENTDEVAENGDIPIDPPRKRCRQRES